MRLIQPIFASTSSSSSGLGAENGIHEAGNSIIERVKKDIDLGVKEFLLFYIPENKLLDDKHNFLKVSRVAQQLTNLNIKLNVDVCLCAYTEDGHCNITGDQDKTEKLLTEQAVQFTKCQVPQLHLVIANQILLKILKMLIKKFLY